jgi:hypothetical protein
LPSPVDFQQRKAAVMKSVGEMTKGRALLGAKNKPGKLAATPTQAPLLPEKEPAPAMKKSKPASQLPSAQNVRDSFEPLGAK